jgi:Tfp pilus assembly major pilin PilA
MLKEDRMACDNEIINLISQKESLDEVLNNYSFFKTSTGSLMDLPIVNSNSNTNNKQNSNGFNHNIPYKYVDMLFHEIITLDFNLLNKTLFSSLCEVLKNCEHKLITSSDISIIPREQILELLKKSIESMKEGYNIYSIDDFFILFCKKLLDILTSSIGGKITKEINVEKFRWFVKYHFKSNYYEGLITSKLSFLNKDYKFLKKEKQSFILEINNKCQGLLSRLEKLEIKENEIRNRIDLILEGKNSNLMDPRLFSLKHLDTKLLSLIELKNDLEKEIQNLNKKKDIIVNKYSEQITDMEKIAEILIRKKANKEEELSVLQIKSKEEIITLRNKISELFKEIKEQLKDMNHDDGEDICKIYLDKINETLNKKSPQKKLERNLSLSPVQHKKEDEREIRTVKNMSSMNGFSQLSNTKKETHSNIFASTYNTKPNSHSNSQTVFNYNNNNKLDFIRTTFLDSTYRASSRNISLLNGDHGQEKFFKTDRSNIVKQEKDYQKK